MKMSENEAQQSIAELFRQLKEGGKPLDVEKRILESLLRKAAKELHWFCNCCGNGLPESRRNQAIEDFVHWGGRSSIKPPARHTSWDDWVEEISYQHTEDQFAGVEGIGPYFCGIACEREEREWQQMRRNAPEEAERQPVEETMGEYGWCSDDEMPIDEHLASGEGYEDSGNLHYNWDEALGGVYDMFPMTLYSHELLDDFDAVVVLALTIVPRQVADWVIENCRIDAIDSALTISPHWLEDKFFLLFNPHSLCARSRAIVIHTILHEAAHAYLGHKSPVALTREEHKEQERQANRLVAQWMRAAQYKKRYGKA